MKTGYLGKHPVTFAYQASKNLEETGDLVGHLTHGDIYESVRSGLVDQGILALENQLAGTVDESLHAIVQPILTQAKPLSESESLVRITRELAVPVELYLMNQSGKIEDIQVVQTHSIPMRQATASLDEIAEHHRFRREPCASTDAAAEAANDDPTVAAISSKLAPSHYQSLKIIRRIDDPIPGAEYQNVTRFWVIEGQPEGKHCVFDPAPLHASEEIHKICLLFNLERDESGALAKSLSVFADVQINLAHIYSLPRRDRSWEYTFVLEFEVPRPAIDSVEGALEHLHQFADYTLLGVYPRYRL